MFRDTGGSSVCKVASEGQNSFHNRRFHLSPIGIFGQSPSGCVHLHKSNPFPMAENNNRYLHILLRHHHNQQSKMCFAFPWPVSIICSHLVFGKPLVSITDASLTKRLRNAFNPAGNLVKYDICIQIYIFLTKSQVYTN